MANISLSKSVRSCKVNTDAAERMYSDRYQNSDAILCPVWNKVDITGRTVCRDSFYTKNQGCNSANDRIVVENDHRPRYMEYVTLNAEGIEGGLKSCQGGQKNAIKLGKGCQGPQDVHQYTGQFGQNNFRSWIETPCAVNKNVEACCSDKKKPHRSLYGRM